jgi:hypothetical protein
MLFLIDLLIYCYDSWFIIIFIYVIHFNYVRLYVHLYFN